MADHDPVEARIADSFAAADAPTWNGLAGSADPFLSHAFFATLEESDSIGEHSGWTPLPLLVNRAGKTLGAAPAFLKTHSQGEYVFDQGWAEAWARAGGDYYPKLQIAVPFTPVVGRRLLGEEPELILATAEAVVRQNELSSAHVTFLTAEEAAAAEARGWLVRHGVQFHWHSAGERNFDGFLERCSSRKRKVIRKERAAAREGLTFRHLRGAEIGAAEMDAMWLFYQDTGSRKWGRPYLTRAFFELAVERLGDDLLLFLAEREGRPIAGALNWVGTDTLYGRYWGCSEDVPFLHFELCYYQAIEWAIAHGRGTVQAGAQGEHKLARGYEPVLTYSAHFIPHAGFRSAVADFLRQEREAVAYELEALRAELPFRKD
ncbi:GNAT family N-acetyltransferase [Sphingomonas sp. LHG3443-2]|uniref:GNAT family N-acetyltransferase n=1 Tax=Sphingomonas sp. LHG3443-2 TaxID=2804639 RepID=UPI003CED6EB6